MRMCELCSQREKVGVDEAELHLRQGVPGKVNKPQKFGDLYMEEALNSAESGGIGGRS